MKRLSNTQGMMLIDTMIGVIVMVLVTGVLVGLFSAGQKSFAYAWKQTTLLTGARQALEGGGNPHGLLWDARQALTVQSLSASSLTATLPGGDAPQFQQSGTQLQTTQQSRTSSLAQNVNTFQINYYNLNSQGHIMVSTSSTLANLVTAQVQFQGSGKKAYTFYTGAQLRNH